MPIRNLTPEQEEAQRETDLLERKQAHDARIEKYAHELRLAELKANSETEIAGMQAVVDGRHSSVKAVCKALTLPIAVFCVTILTLKDREVPATLQDFLRL